MSEITKDLKEKLGVEKVEEIIEKEWKVVEPPTAEELAQAPSTHPKARNNPNSRKNLAQYNKRAREAKEKAIENLQIKEVEEDINPQDIFGAGVEEVVIKKIDAIIRPRSVFKGRIEQDVFWTTAKLFLEDFKTSELSNSDLDDIANLAKNRVMEHRLNSAVAKQNDPKILIDIQSTVDKINKNTDKLKENLSSRRVDRIDSKNKPALSIVDLVAHLDHQGKLDFQKRIDELEKKQVEYLPPLRDAEGKLIED